MFGGPGDDLVAAGFTPEDPGDDALFGGSGADLAAFAAADDDRLDGGPASTGSTARRAPTAA